MMSVQSVLISIVLSGSVLAVNNDPNIMIERKAGDNHTQDSNKITKLHLLTTSNCYHLLLDLHTLQKPRPEEKITDKPTI